MRRPVLAVCTALGVLVLLGLGTWQVARLQWKEDLIARTEALTARPPVLLAAGPHQAYTPVRTTGGFTTDRTVHVVGTLDGAAGYYVFQPFKPDGAPWTVLVNRGFVRAEDRQDSYTLPDAAALTALVREYEEPSAFAPPPDADGATAYERSFATLTSPFAGQTVTFAPFYLDSTLPTERPRGGTTRLDFSNRHLGYAITWYGLAAGLVAVYALMARRR